MAKENVTKLIKSKLILKGLKQEELAEMIGISTTSLNTKINGKAQFKLNELVKISKVLEIDVKSFFD